MSDEDYTGGPLDVATLKVIAQRATAHPLVDGRAFRPDALSPRRLEVRFDASQYPTAIDAARLDLRWYDGGDYTVHYHESRGRDVWQCRWDRHPKPREPRAHFHPPPDAAPTVEPSPLEGGHHLDVVFAVLEWVSERVEDLYEG